MLRNIVYAMIAGIFAFGCAGETKNLVVKDADGKPKTVVFPQGTITGAASKEQAAAQAEIFVESHNSAMHEMGEIKELSRKSLSNQEEIKASLQKAEDLNRKIIESDRMNLEASKSILAAIEKMREKSKEQGTGEITIFYQSGSAAIKTESLEYARLVRFMDYLSRESRGRRIIFLSIGSASSFGNRKVNIKLARMRANAPLDIIDKYLVNVPHEFYKVYGTGDTFSPKNVRIKKHQRYQHARLIAVYDVSQAPPLPEP